MKNGDIVIYKNEVGTVVADFENKEVSKFLPCNYGNYHCSELDTISENDVREATHEEKLDLIRREYNWGHIVTIHCIGEYQIVESIKGDNKHWHGYFNYKDTHIAYLSLDAALAGCIGYKYEGENGKAVFYFNKMIGIE